MSKVSRVVWVIEEKLEQGWSPMLQHMYETREEARSGHKTLKIYTKGLKFRVVPYVCRPARGRWR